MDPSRGISTNSLYQRKRKTPHQPQQNHNEKDDANRPIFSSTHPQNIPRVYQPIAIGDNDQIVTLSNQSTPNKTSPLLINKNRGSTSHISLNAWHVQNTMSPGGGSPSHLTPHNNQPNVTRRPDYDPFLDFADSNSESELTTSITGPNLLGSVATQGLGPNTTGNSPRHHSSPHYPDQLAPYIPPSRIPAAPVEFMNNVDDRDDHDDPRPQITKPSSNSATVAPLERTSSHSQIYPLYDTGSVDIEHREPSNNDLYGENGSTMDQFGQHYFKQAPTTSKTIGLSQNILFHDGGCVDTVNYGNGREAVFGDDDDVSDDRLIPHSSLGPFVSGLDKRSGSFGANTHQSSQQLNMNGNDNSILPATTTTTIASPFVSASDLRVRVSPASLNETKLLSTTGSPTTTLSSPSPLTRRSTQNLTHQSPIILNPLQTQTRNHIPNTILRHEGMPSGMMNIDTNINFLLHPTQPTILPTSLTTTTTTTTTPHSPQTVPSPILPRPIPTALLYDPEKFDIVLLCDNRERMVRRRDGWDTPTKIQFGTELQQRGLKSSAITTLSIGDFLWIMQPKPGWVVNHDLSVTKLTPPQQQEQLAMRKLHLGNHKEYGQFDVMNHQRFVLNFIIERKTLEDLSQTIGEHGNRYSDQLRRLTQSGIRNVLYLIEDITMDANADYLNRHAKKATKTSTSLASMSIQRGMFKIFTKSHQDTVNFLLQMHAWVENYYKSIYDYIQRPRGLNSLGLQFGFGRKYPLLPTYQLLSRINADYNNSHLYSFYTMAPMIMLRKLGLDMGFGEEKGDEGMAIIPPSTILAHNPTLYHLLGNYFESAVQQQVFFHERMCRMLSFQPTHPPKRSKLVIKVGKQNQNGQQKQSSGAKKRGRPTVSEKNTLVPFLAATAPTVTEAKADVVGVGALTKGIQNDQNNQKTNISPIPPSPTPPSFPNFTHRMIGSGESFASFQNRLDKNADVTPVVKFGQMLLEIKGVGPLVAEAVATRYHTAANLYLKYHSILTMPLNWDCFGDGFDDSGGINNNNGQFLPTPIKAAMSKGQSISTDLTIPTPYRSGVGKFSTGQRGRMGGSSDDYDDDRDNDDDDEEEDDADHDDDDDLFDPPDTKSKGGKGAKTNSHKGDKKNKIVQNGHQSKHNYGKSSTMVKSANSIPNGINKSKNDTKAENSFHSGPKTLYGSSASHFLSDLFETDPSDKIRHAFSPPTPGIKTKPNDLDGPIKDTQHRNFRSLLSRLYPTHSHHHQQEQVRRIKMAQEYLCKYTIDDKNQKIGPVASARIFKAVMLDYYD